GLQVDAEQFGGQQMTVNYHIRGRIIQVPSNYARKNARTAVSGTAA
ncbi:putative host specificity protein, partial [Escherichia coli O55:H7 str. USDA 5905]